jgi:protein involved in temperature-dependent protein secretion
MGLLLRLRIVIATYVTVGAIGVVYAKLQSPLIEAGKSGGQFEGFLSDRIADLDALLPIVLGLLVLGVTVWFVVATVQNERTESRTVRRP